MFEADFLHQTRKPDHEVFCEPLNHSQGYEVILLLIVELHEVHFFTRVLHKREKLLKL
jgi:hypothetical protein